MHIKVISMIQKNYNSRKYDVHNWKIHRYRSNSRMVRLSNIFADKSSKVCKNRIQIFPWNHKNLLFFTMHFFHSCNFMQCDWRTFILWLKSQFMVKRCVLNFSCDLNYFGEFFWSAKHNTLSFHWKGKHKYYIRLLYKW